MSESIGELRALFYHNWLERAEYLSAVSSAAFVASILSRQSNLSAVQRLLGTPSTTPDKLFTGTHEDETAGNLSRTDRLSLAQIPQHGWWFHKYLNYVQLLLSSLITNNPWREFIEENVLAPYLVDSDELSAVKFPQLIIGSTVSRDFAAINGIAPVELSDNKVRIRSDLFLSDKSGTFMLPAQSASLWNPYKHTRTTLADILACSSANFSIVFDYLKHISQINSLGNLSIVPQYQGVTLFQDGVKQKVTMVFGDGGFRDFLGITPLLARGVKNILVFIHAPIGIRSLGPERLEIASPIPPLFGYVSKGYLARETTGERYSQLLPDMCHSNCYLFECPEACEFTQNQVFPEHFYQPFVDHILEARLQGLPALYYQELPVLANPYFGIEGRYNAHILWVYPDQSLKWWNLLTYPLQEAIGLSKEFTTDAASSLSPATECQDANCLDQRLRFPFFSTMGELKLSPVQVNLLASYTEWMLTQEKFPVYPLLKDGLKDVPVCNSRELLEAFFSSSVKEKCQKTYGKEAEIQN